MEWPIGLAEQLKDFAQYHGHEELSFTLSKVDDILHEFNSGFHNIKVVRLKLFLQGNSDQSILHAKDILWAFL